MLLAVMDLGSNSFKMTVAQWAPEINRRRPFRVLHKERHPLQLGGSVFSTGRISNKHFRDAVKALQKMQARLRDYSSPILRVVATSAIRDSSNGRAFIQYVRANLGLSIDVISGSEEARLIAAGLALEFPRIKKGLLVDIGGGSSEIASFGGDSRLPFYHSFRLGSVRLAMSAFRGSRKNWDEETIRKSVRAAFRNHVPPHAERLIGSAGTIQSIGQILASVSADRQVKKTALDAWITKNLRSPTSTLQKKFKLQPSRARVIVPGAIILSEILGWLKMNELTVTGMTLRDGVMVDLVRSWRVQETQILRPASTKSSPFLRSSSDRALSRYLEKAAQRFQVDMGHSHHIAALALSLFDQMSEVGPGFTADERKYLLVASYLHDSGKIVSEAAHHKHSAYLIRNLNVPGLTTLESKKAALVALYHRKENPPKKDPLPFGLTGVHADQVRRLSALLRLADGLDSDLSQNVTGIKIRVSKKQIFFELALRNPRALNVEAFREKAAYFEEFFGLKLTSFVHPKPQTLKLASSATES